MPAARNQNPGFENLGGHRPALATLQAITQPVSALGLHTSKATLNVVRGVGYRLATGCGPCGTQTSAQEKTSMQHNGLDRAKLCGKLNPDFLKQRCWQQSTSTNNDRIVRVLL